MVRIRDVTSFPHLFFCLSAASKRAKIYKMLVARRLPDQTGLLFGMPNEILGAASQFSANETNGTKKNQPFHKSKYHYSSLVGDYYSGVIYLDFPECYLNESGLHKLYTGLKVRL